MSRWPVILSQFRLFPERASSSAWQVDMLFFALLGFSLLIVLTVMALVIGFAIRYRAGNTAASREGAIRNTLKYESVWVVAFTGIGLGIFGWASWVYFGLQRAPEDATPVYIIAKQWMWKVSHAQPNGPTEIDELHVPVGEAIRLVMTSEDVIHSFYIPAFRIKQDVLPGRYTSTWFQATEPGTYALKCSEYCGTGHAQMDGHVVVMPPDEYQRWLESQPREPAPPPAAPGAPGTNMVVDRDLLFTQFGCNACHLKDSAQYAPRLDGVYGGEVHLDNGQTIVADEQYIRESILRPNARISAGYPSPSLMPAYEGQISEAQLQQLVEFIRSLQHGWPDEEQDSGDADPAKTEGASP